MWVSHSRWDHSGLPTTQSVQVYLAPCEPDALMADVMGLHQEAAAKALVDDVYLVRLG